MSTDTTRSNSRPNGRSNSAARRSRSVRPVRPDRAVGEARRRHPSAQVIDLREDPGRPGSRQRSSRRHGDGGRTLALLDVENLLPGDPAEADADDYRHALAEAAAVAELTTTDSTVLAVGSGNDTGLFACVGTWPGAAVRCRGGLDGADRALTEHVADVDAVARSYDQVVIGSGDHHFIACVRRLRASGVRTTVVARADKLSGQLRRVADRVLLLPAGARFLEITRC